MVRIVCISDTHSLEHKMLYNVEDFVDPNQYNMLIHAGDVTNVGYEFEVRDFIYWFQNIKGFDTKIFIAGNHDFSFQEKPAWINNYINEENLTQSDVVYLEDNFFTIEIPEFSKPIKIHGSPWQPEFLNWAFNLPRNGKELKEKWNMIPNDCDILITHGPPFGIFDIVNPTPRYNFVNSGCELLLKRIKKIKPLIHIFGHIHSGNGIKKIGKTTFINASTCTESYKPTYKPIVVDLKENKNKISVTNILI